MRKRGVLCTAFVVALAIWTYSSGAICATDDGASRSVASAYRICQAVDNTGLASEPCSVSGWGSSINIRMDMDSANARTTCAGMVDLAHKENLYFDRGWTIRIYSPYSGDHPIATCSL